MNTPPATGLCPQKLSSVWGLAETQTYSPKGPNPSGLLSAA